jgi:hypothetical protein
VKTVFICGVAVFLVFLGCLHVQAQEVRLDSAQPDGQGQSAAELPDAPRPQIELAELVAAFDQPGTQQSSSSSSSAQQTDTTQQQPQHKSAHDTAEEQLKLQEKQRVAGVVPSFNISYISDAVALTSAQKFKLVFHVIIDPVTIGTAFLNGGYREVHDNDTGFEWGVKGYFLRSGAAYLDAVNSNLIGNALLPSLLHQDPRFFRLGHGPTAKRLLYAASSSFICKGDKSRKWQPNFSNVLGNIAAGEISNFYYPSGDPADFDTTISTAMIQTVEGSLGSVFQEFWPDISRKWLHKDPTRGLDAQWEKEHQEALQKKNK